MKLKKGRERDIDQIASDIADKEEDRRFEEAVKRGDANPFRDWPGYWLKVYREVVMEFGIPEEV